MREIKNGNLHAMKTAIFSVGLALFASGCATTPKGRAVELVVISDPAADQMAAGWEAFVDAQVDHCRSTLGDDATKEQREDCMGLAGKGEPIEPVVQALVMVQTAIKEGVKCEELKSCASKVNWKELRDEIIATWNELKPYIDAIGEK